MSTMVVLLRGINVGGNKRIGMADLRTALNDVGYDRVDTVLQSGNLIIGRARTSVEEDVEGAIHAAFSMDVTAIARTPKHFVDLVSAPPFTDEQLSDPRMAHVAFCRGEPDTAGLESLLASVSGPESAWVRETDVLVHYPEGSARSKLTNASLEKACKTSMTARNWNTIVRIANALSR